MSIFVNLLRKTHLPAAAPTHAMAILSAAAAKVIPNNRVLL
jgi:hypothetical protein